VEQMVCHTQVSSYLRDRPRRVSYQPDCFVFKFLRGPPSCLGDHSVLRFHHSPPSGGVCEIRGRSSTHQSIDGTTFRNYSDGKNCSSNRVGSSTVTGCY